MSDAGPSPLPPLRPAAPAHTLPGDKSEGISGRDCRGQSWMTEIGLARRVRFRIRPFRMGSCSSTSLCSKGGYRTELLTRA